MFYRNELEDCILLPTSLNSAHQFAGDTGDTLYKKREGRGGGGSGGNTKALLFPNVS